MNDKRFAIIKTPAQMLELADRLASGASVRKERGSSNLPLGTPLADVAELAYAQA